MQSKFQPQLPGHVSADQFTQILITPESFAARPESLTEQLFIADHFLYMIHVLEERSNAKKMIGQ